MTKQNLSPFEENVWEGLSKFPKQLSSKFIYDKKGDWLFQQIMAMPSYYLTDCEYEILESHKEKLTENFTVGNEPIDLIDLGAGDGKKTKILLRYMVKKGIDFIYKPIDISQTILDELKDSLEIELPDLKVELEQGEYFAILNRLKELNQRKKVILILGSNIGNLLHPKAIEFLTELKNTLNDKDLVFMGFDQKKYPQTISDAYNDEAGITAEFNKNILHRINRELGGDFQPDKFIHWESYNPETGTCSSFLVATEPMKVRIEKLDMDISFDKWETIHTEISQKYTDKVVAWLAKESGLKITETFTDSRDYYKNYIFKKG